MATKDFRAGGAPAPGFLGTTPSATPPAAAATECVTDSEHASPGRRKAQDHACDAFEHNRAHPREPATHVATV